jgi:serine/threonine protein kinase
VECRLGYYLTLQHSLCFLQIAIGLAYLHSEGVVHGDLKPSNVLIAAGGAEVAIADFGLARYRAIGAASTTGSTSSLRGAGTDSFKAPELFEEDDDGAPLHAPSFKTDVFGFAVTAFCVLVARALPYAAVDAAGKPILPSKRVPKGLRPDLRELPPGLPPELLPLLERCWAKDPAARSSALDVLTALEGLLRVGQPLAGEKTGIPTLPEGRSTGGGGSASGSTGCSQGVPSVIPSASAAAASSSLGDPGALVVSAAASQQAPSRSNLSHSATPVIKGASVASPATTPQSAAITHTSDRGLLKTVINSAGRPTHLGTDGLTHYCGMQVRN